MYQKLSPKFSCRVIVPARLRPRRAAGCRSFRSVENRVPSYFFSAMPFCRASAAERSEQLCFSFVVLFICSLLITGARRFLPQLIQPPVERYQLDTFRVQLRRQLRLLLCESLFPLLQLIDLSAYSLQFTLWYHPGFHLFFRLLKHPAHFYLSGFRLANPLTNFADLARQPGDLFLLQSQSLNCDLSLISVRLQSLDFNPELSHFAQDLLNDLLLIGLIEGGSRA